VDVYRNCNVSDIDKTIIVVSIRDVKTVYFSEPVTGLPKPVTERPIVSGIIVTGRTALAIYQSIACCFTAAVVHIPDAWTPTPRNKGQWRIKAVGAEGRDVSAAVS